MVNRIAIALVLLLLAGGGVFWQEQRVRSALDQRDTARVQLAAAQAAAKSAKTTTTVVTQYVDRVQIVREAGATITREVPVYVTAKADTACPVPLGFVRVHDAAAAGQLPQRSAGDLDAPAPGVALSTVADTVADNYTTCHETREQLIALQAWVRAHLAAAAP